MDVRADGGQGGRQGARQVARQGGRVDVRVDASMDARVDALRMRAAKGGFHALCAHFTPMTMWLMKARISSTRHTVVLGPSFTGCGKRFSLTPSHPVVLLTGISSRIWASRKKPVGGNCFVKSSDTGNSFGNDFPRDTMRFWTNRAKRQKGGFYKVRVCQGMRKYFCICIDGVCVIFSR